MQCNMTTMSCGPLHGLRGIVWSTKGHSIALGTYKMSLNPLGLHLPLAGCSSGLRVFNTSRVEVVTYLSTIPPLYPPSVILVARCLEATQSIKFTSPLLPNNGVRQYGGPRAKDQTGASPSQPRPLTRLKKTPNKGRPLCVSMTPLFVGSSASIKEEGSSCLPRRWFNGPGRNNGATFKPPPPSPMERLIIWARSQRVAWSTGTFPLGLSQRLRWTAMRRMEGGCGGDGG